MKTSVIEVQYKTQKIEELEAKLAEKDEEIRQLKRWKDGLKTIYEDLIDEKDAEINRLKGALSILQTRPQVER